MISFHKARAVGFIAGIVFISVLAAAPASASGGGGMGGGGMRGGPGGGPPPVFLEGSSTGRAVESTCSLSRNPVANTSGKRTGYRRAEFCN
jgi:hypothetical protein